MKIKKILTLAAAAVLSVSMLSGCSGGQTKIINSVEDLPGATIGVQQGTTGDDIATGYEKEPGSGTKVERYSKGADAVNALKQGKIDCVLIDNEPAKAFVASNDDLKIIEGAFEKEDYAMAIKKGNSELLEKLNKAIQELKDDGTIKKILDNYIGDNTGSFKYTSPEGTDRSNGKFVMATNAAFAPYEYLEGGKIVGIDPDIMQAICDKLGMELEIEDMEFESIIPAVQTGKADIGVAGMTVDETRLQSVDFTDSYAQGLQVIIVKK